METERTKLTTSTVVKPDANRDPLTGAPGAHPVGVGTGAAAGGAAGAVIGAIAGPIGALAGGVAGAVAGAIVGKGAAEAVNPTVEHAYWRSEFGKRPYFMQGSAYDQYGPAYQLGWESHASYSTKGKTFDEVEADLRRDWDRRHGSSKLTWENAKSAARDAWQRMEKPVCSPCES